MALNKDVLGQKLYDIRKKFSNKTIDELLQEYGGLEEARLAACKEEANEIIIHFKTAGELQVPGTGLVAGANPVTGTSVLGKIM